MADINGTAAAEILDGTADADRIAGGGGNDTINGGEGDDLLDGEAGSDVVNGDGGDDTITVGGGTAQSDTPLDEAHGGDGLDHLVVDYSRLSSANVTFLTAPVIDADGAAATIRVNGIDKLVFSGIEQLTIVTGGGADTVYAVSDDDIVSTGGANDTIHSAPGAGRDRIDAGDGSQDAVAADWSDLGAGEAVVLDLNDAAGVTLGTGASERYLRGVERLIDFSTGAGDDVITLHRSGLLTNAVATNDGDDQVTIFGNTLYDNTRRNIVELGAGNDRLQIDYSSMRNGVVMDAALFDADGASGQIQLAGRGVYITYSGADSLDIVTGQEADTIRGISDDDVIATGAGNDSIISAIGAGRDRIDGGEGSQDSVTADWSDLGADEGVVLDLNDPGGVTLHAGEANERYLRGIERLQSFATGAGDDVITLGSGGNLDNYLDTRGGDDLVTLYGNTLYDNTGRQQIHLGAGDDRLVVDYSTMRHNFVMTAPVAGADGTSGAISVPIRGDFVTFSGVEHFTLTTGSDSYNDNIATAGGDDIIRTGGGSDTVDAGGGDDLVEGGAGNDVLNGGDGADTVSFESAASGVTVDLGLTAQQDTVGAGLDTLSNFENLTGSAHDDTLTGDGGDNFIDGGAGADVMAGGAGNDGYVVDEASVGPLQTLANYDYYDIASGSRALTPDLVATGITAASLDIVGALSGSPFDNHFYVSGWGTTLDPAKYYETTLSAAEGAIDFESVSFSMEKAGGTSATWVLRSSLDNFAGDIATGSLTNDNVTNFSVDLSGLETASGPVTFRWYLSAAVGGTTVGFANHQSPGSGFGAEIPGLDLAFAGRIVTGDRVIENGGEGDADYVETALAAYALPDNVEQLFGTGDAGQALTGNGLDNLIVGGAGDDLLDGGAGDDSIDGGDGEDTAIFGGNQADYDFVDNGDGSYTFLDKRVASPDGADRLRSVENVRFADGSVTLASLFVNDAPVIANLQGDIASQTEGVGGTTYLDAGRDAVVADVDSADFDGGQLVVSIANHNGTDSIGIFSDSNVTRNTTTGEVSVGGVVIGTVSGGVYVFPRSDTLTIDLNENAAPALVQSLIRSLIVRDQRIEPVGGTRDITLSLSDGDGGTATYTTQLNVIAINDEPGGADRTITIDEDSPHSFGAADFGFVDNFDDGDGGIAEGQSLAAVIITTLPAAGSLTLNGAPVSAGQTIVAADLPSLVFTPAPNASGANHASFTFQVVDSGPSGGADQNTDQTPNTISFDVDAIDDAAEAADDSVATDEATVAVGNVFDDNGAGSDVDVDSPLAVASVNGSAAAVGTEIRLASGALLTLNADGTFAYDPNGRFDYLVSAATAAATGAVNVFATDSFSYTLVGGDTATVTVTIAGLDSAGDRLDGDSGDDAITGTGASEFFWLQQGGNDEVSAGGGDDRITFLGTFTADDFVDGGGGHDTLRLGGVYDLALDSSMIANVELLMLLGGGGNAYDLTAADDLVGRGALLQVNGRDLGPGETMRFDGSAETDGFLLLVGGAGGDTLIGGERRDELFGGAGDDSLFGNGGDDHIDGGAGIDAMAGGAGNDLYYVDDSADQVIELAGGGIDLVRASVSYTLGDQVENLALTEAGGAIDATGNALANALTGNAFANVLDGGAGADRMKGRGGDDTYIVDHRGDRAIEDGADGGTDTVHASVSFTLGRYVENLVLTGANAIDATGNAEDNVLTGNDAANILNGAGGADTMIGGGGDDLYYVDDVADRVVELAGGGADQVRSSVSHALAAEVENLTLTGDRAIDGAGNDGANVIKGNRADNVLSGGGDDVLAGGLGNDLLRGDAGADGFRFDTALDGDFNVDRILDFESGVDRILLDESVFAGLTAGALAEDAFRAGAAAADADDRIIYDAATGRLWFDADGSGAAEQILFATLDPGTRLGAGDIAVVGDFVF